MFWKINFTIKILVWWCITQDVRVYTDVPLEKQTSTRKLFVYSHVHTYSRFKVIQVKR